MWQRALTFHNANPWIYDELKEICFSLKNRGFPFYSSRTIISVLRFKWDLKTGGEEVQLVDGTTRRVKLNNNHSPYFARMLIEEFPSEFWDFLELRACPGDPVAPVKPAPVVEQVVLPIRPPTMAKPRTPPRWNGSRWVVEPAVSDPSRKVEA